MITEESQTESEQRPIRLTKRECQVLRLVAMGATSQEVGDSLCVSRRTVDFHLANVFSKLQVGNRLQALREAARNGLIPFEPETSFTRWN
ncbi:MAG: helix-turn-helix domain-containing protein [Fimbriimonas sp.]